MSCVNRIAVSLLYLIWSLPIRRRSRWFYMLGFQAHNIDNMTTSTRYPNVIMKEDTSIMIIWAMKIISSCFMRLVSSLNWAVLIQKNGLTREIISDEWLKFYRPYGGKLQRIHMNIISRSQNWSMNIVLGTRGWQIWCRPLSKRRVSWKFSKLFLTKSWPKVDKKLKNSFWKISGGSLTLSISLGICCAAPRTKNPPISQQVVSTQYL